MPLAIRLCQTKATFYSIHNGGGHISTVIIYAGQQSKQLTHIIYPNYIWLPIDRKCLFYYLSFFSQLLSKVPEEDDNKAYMQLELLCSNPNLPKYMMWLKLKPQPHDLKDKWNISKFEDDLSVIQQNLRIRQKMFNVPRCQAHIKSTSREKERRQPKTACAWNILDCCNYTRQLNKSHLIFIFPRRGTYTLMSFIKCTPYHTIQTQTVSSRNQWRELVYLTAPWVTMNMRTRKSNVFGECH